MASATSLSSSSPWSSRRVAVVNGLADKRLGTGAEFETRPLGSFWNFPPTAKPKHQALAFLPSLYHEHDAREHRAQREHGAFVALIGDIDTGNHSINDIEAAVVALVGDGAYKVHSTARAGGSNMKWRTIMPLAEPLSFVDWRDAQEAMFDFMRSRGIEMDGVTERAGQIIFLPNVPCTNDETGEALRDEHGRPLYYSTRASDTNAPGLCVDRGPLAEGIAAVRQRRADDEALKVRLRAEAERRRAARPQTDGEKVIDAFNRSNALTDLLVQYGYEQASANSNDWRSPNQTSGSYATQVRGDKWVSLSGTDTALGLGSRHDAGCYGDAYDLFVFYEHGGDRKSAWKAACNEQGRAWERPSPGVILKTYEADRLEAEARIDSGESDEVISTQNAAKLNSREPSEGSKREGLAVCLDAFRAFMPTHTYIFMPTGEFWPSSSVNSRIPPVPLFDHDGRPVLSEKKGKEDEQVAIPANVWLDQNRPVEQMTWAPGFPQIIRDRVVDGGWLPKPGVTVFNLYRPPHKIPGDATMAQPWIDHVHRVYPDDADHIIKWLAHRVQKPGEKVNHAIVMGGNQGVGKDTILEPVKFGVGPHNFTEVAPHHILERFNGFAKSVILRVSEARDLGESDRFAFYDRMKVYTAAPPDVLRVDEKHVKEYSAFNVCGVIVTSNHKTDGVFLPADDRRHYVAWSDAIRADFPPEYFTRIYDWFEQGGTGHVVAYLSSLDLSDFNAKAPPPKTPAFWDIVSANQSPEDAEMNDALETLSWPNAVTIQMVADSSSNSFREFLLERRNSRRIPHRFEECGYVQVRNEAAQDGLFKVSGKRCTIYARKSLSRRDQYAAADRLIYPGGR